MRQSIILYTEPICFNFATEYNIKLYDYTKILFFSVLQQNTVLLWERYKTDPVIFSLLKGYSCDQVMSTP
jgi:hypothetical protein